MNARNVFLIIAIMFGASASCAADSASPWKRFVSVEGQPEPVPAQWVATPEGKFAHSIKIPSPVPQDSGYKPGMSSKEYFEHLCKTEAGEFIYKTVDNVEGFYFMRPPKRPTDAQLKDRWALEAPGIERFYQLVPSNPDERARVFINPPWRLYAFIEEPLDKKNMQNYYVRAHGYKQRATPMQVDSVVKLKSRYGLLWRGIHRSHDREISIAGYEWVILDLTTNEILALNRNYALSPKMRNVQTGIWWLNASKCPSAKRDVTAADDGQRIYEFVSKVIKPAMEKQE